MDTVLPPDSLADLVAAVNDQLTPSEHRLAREILDDPTTVAFGTVADLARLVGVSRPTVVRFARTLGFEGYAELQAHMQASLADTITRPRGRIRSRGVAVSRVRGELLTAIEHLFQHLTDDRTTMMVAPIVAARTVFVCSGETAQAGAHVLASGLRMLGKDVVFIEDQRSGGQLAHAAPGDTVVVFDFHRYRRRAFDAVSYLKSQGAAVIAITDGALSPYAAMADAWCDVLVPAMGPFDSSVPAVMAAETIVAGVASTMGTEAVFSIDRTEAAWDATSTFLD